MFCPDVPNMLLRKIDIYVHMRIEEKNGGMSDVRFGGEGDMHAILRLIDDGTLT
jgi:hypothetical protein